MSSRTVVSVRELGKRYDLGKTFASNTLRDSIREGARRLLRRSRSATGKSSREFWALKDVSFDVAEGEVLGIVGPNGAGKSTLLKILSQITEPTRGDVRVRGRVASLLEVGTGFHPELSGRENVFMNGAILGMGQAEIRRKFDEIVEFGGVGPFIDIPVKRYSSGMLIRLGFAVAAHLEPEILVVDEVLAVGDMEFQQKCMRKMDEVSRAGRTVLFVSHNLGAIQRLCSRCLLIAGGTLQFDGESSETVRSYLYSIQPTSLSWHRNGEAAADRAAVVESVEVCSAAGQVLKAVTTASDVAVKIRCLVRKDSSRLRLAMAVADAAGQFVFSTNPGDVAVPHPRVQGRYDYVVRLPAGTLLPRRYSLTVSLYEPHRSIDSRPSCIVFDVVPGGTEPGGTDYKRPGFVRIPCQWSGTHA